MKLCWSLALVGIALLMVVVTVRAESDLWEEDDKEVLVRTVRGTKERGTKFNSDSTYTSRRNKAYLISAIYHSSSLPPGCNNKLEQ